MDLGLSKLVTPALEWLCEIVGQYGWAIIIATVILRLVILPLDIRQRKSSLQMQALKPKVDEINKRFANDPQMRQQATQKLYKKEGVSTLAGCLPMLIQLPVFIAFFNAMRNISNKVTYEFYNLAKAGNTAGFEQLLSRCKFLWIGNVFQPDAIYVINLRAFFTNAQQATVNIIPDAATASTAFSALGVNVADYAEVMTDFLAKYNVRTNGLFIIAILAGAATFLQQKLTPNTTPEDQQGTMKGMMIFMVVFSVYLCATYNAAFGIYWMTTSVIGMALQAVLNKIYSPERLAKKNAVSGPLTAFPDRKSKRAAQKEQSEK